MQHNNKRYGLGVFYVAKITGRDPKFILARDFLTRDVDISDSSSTRWYSFTVDITEDGIYEVKESNAFKRTVYYLSVENGVAREITKDGVLDMIP